MDILTYRLADEEDVDLLFQWANDDDVRRNSFSSAKIPYEDHLKWFSKILNDKNCEIYIFYREEKPVGQVRLNYDSKNAQISYSISKEFRGQGFGKLLISLIEKIVRKNHPEITVLTAKVKPDNIASQKIFEDNNYVMIKSDEHAVDYEKNIQLKDAEISKECLINISGGGEYSSSPTTETH